MTSFSSEMEIKEVDIKKETTYKPRENFHCDKNKIIHDSRHQNEKHCEQTSGVEIETVCIKKEYADLESNCGDSRQAVVHRWNLESKRTNKSLKCKDNGSEHHGMRKQLKSKGLDEGRETSNDVLAENAIFIKEEEIDIEMGDMQLEQRQDLKCLNCKKVFKTTNTFNIHMLKFGQHKTCKSEKRFPKPEILHPCLKCDYVSSQKSNLDRHMNLKHGEFIIKSIRRKKYENFRDNSEIHEIEQTQNYLKDFHVQTNSDKNQANLLNCLYCKFTTLNKIEYTKHFLAVHTNVKNSKEDEIVTCACGYSSPSKYNLRCHAKRKHCPIRSHICKICKNAFKTSASLTQHMKLHNKSSLLRCDFCEYTNINSANLRRHVDSKHSKNPENVYKCELCAYKSLVKENFQTHVRHAHTKGKIYQCEYCKASFKGSSHLNEHILVHKGHKPHQCKYCIYATARSSNLQLHMKTKHKTQIMNNAESESFKIIKNDNSCSFRDVIFPENISGLNK